MHCTRILFRALVPRAYREQMTAMRMYALCRKAKALEIRIEEHFEEASRYVLSSADGGSSLDPIDDPLSEDEDGDAEITPDTTWPPSLLGVSVKLSLPSAHPRVPQQIRLPAGVAEARLRVVQLNETLRDIRISINERYYWMRAKFKAKGKKDRARFDSLSKDRADTLNGLVRIYNRARSALLFLKPDALDNFPVLQSADVRIPTWMIGNNPGGRQGVVSWIWKGYGALRVEGDTVEECMVYFCS